MNFGLNYPVRQPGQVTIVNETKSAMVAAKSTKAGLIVQQCPHDFQALPKFPSLPWRP
jgi:hypothetical protein